MPITNQNTILENHIKKIDANDERQYMLNEDYEVYEKRGAPFGAQSLHYHNFYEIVYVMEGEYSSMVEEQTYHLKKGDFLLINKNVMHKYHYIEKKHDSSKRMILWISEPMLSALSGGEENLTECFEKRGSFAYRFPIYYEEMLRGYLLKLAMTEGILVKGDGIKKVLDRGYLTLFFGYLNELCDRKEYWFQDEMVVTHPLVEKISSYIEENIGNPITVDQLAEHVHMSKYYFLRKFKELTGVTAHGFLINKRLISACEMLEKGESVGEVYQKCGFSDYTSFLRNFKGAFGVPPGKYSDYFMG